MNCRQAQSLLSEYLDNELTREQKQQVDTHLVTCADCSAALELMQAAVGALHDLPVETLPAEAAVRLKDRLGLGDQAKRRRFEVPRWLLSPVFPTAAVGVAVLALVVTLATQGQRQSTLRSPGVPGPAAESPQSQAPRKAIEAPAAKSRNFIPGAPPLVVIGDRNYGPKDLARLVEPRRLTPVGRYPDQVKRLVEAAGDRGSELRRALRVAHGRRPDATPVYAERARYHGHAAWLIVLQDPAADRQVLVVRIRR